MLSRCPGCGSQTKEDERVCAACGWDFASHKRIELPAKKPAEAPAADGEPLDLDAPQSVVLPPSREAALPVESQKPSEPESEKVRLEEKAAVDPPPAKVPPEPAVEGARPERAETVAVSEPAPACAEETALAAAPPATSASTPAARSDRRVSIAAAAGAAIIAVSVLAVYRLLRPESPAAPVAPVASQPLPETPSRPLVENRPAAVFIAPPRVRIISEVNVAAPAPETAVKTDGLPMPTATQEIPKNPAPARRAKPRGPAWSFEGMVFDLITARDVFAVKLSFLDSDGNVVGETETGGDGRYKITVPAGGARGYTLRLAHGDYSGRYIDEGDAANSLRDATPDERRILMQAAARNLPWVGAPDKIVRRDLAILPRFPEKP